MTDDQKSDLQYRIQDEGTDYTFDGYSDWQEVKDPLFQHLRLNYLAAKLALESYIKK